MIAHQTFLMDGEVVGLAHLRETVVRHMAADLIQTGNYADRGEAVRQLHRDGYKVIDVLLLVDDARQVAMQYEVAKIMAAS